jgi:hypothetical protein
MCPESWVGISGNQHFGRVVLPNRLTGAVYHHFLVNDLQVFLEHASLQNDNIYGSCMMGHHFISITSSERIWTRLPVKSGNDAEVQSTDSENLLIFGCGDTKGFSVLSVGKWVRGITAMSREWMSEVSSVTRNFLAECVLLCDEERAVWLKCMRTNRASRDHANIVRIWVGTGIWTYVDWSESYTHFSLKFFFHHSVYSCCSNESKCTVQLKPRSCKNVGSVVPVFTDSRGQPCDYITVHLSSPI